MVLPDDAGGIGELERRKRSGKVLETEVPALGFEVFKRAVLEPRRVACAVGDRDPAHRPGTEAGLFFEPSAHLPGSIDVRAGELRSAAAHSPADRPVGWGERETDAGNRVEVVVDTGPVVFDTDLDIDFTLAGGSVYDLRGDREAGYRRAGSVANAHLGEATGEVVVFERATIEEAPAAVGVFKEQFVDLVKAGGSAGREPDRSQPGAFARRARAERGGRAVDPFLAGFGGRVGDPQPDRFDANTGIGDFDRDLDRDRAFAGIDLIGGRAEADPNHIRRFAVGTVVDLEAGVETIFVKPGEVAGDGLTLRIDRRHGDDSVLAHRRRRGDVELRAQFRQLRGARPEAGFPPHAFRPFDRDLGGLDAALVPGREREAHPPIALRDFDVFVAELD